VHRFLANPGTFLYEHDKWESDHLTVNMDFSSDAAQPSILEDKPLTATNEKITISLSSLYLYR
jgi:hypothetical protein